MNKAVKKTLIISGAVVCGIAALFLLLYITLAIIGCAMYGQAREVREYVCMIPELGSGFAPQGVTYSESEDLYILTGYDGDNTTLLYLVKDKTYRRVKLKGEDGKTLKGHAGGVTVTKDRVYIAGSSSLILFSLAELVGADKDTEVTAKATFYVDNNAAYCYSNDDFLYVGEFYRASNYETDESRYFTTPAGEENKAIVSCYKLDDTGLLIQEDDGQAYPEYCISVTGLVQGFAIKDDVCVLSRSYGLKNSSLEYHKLSCKGENTISVKFKKNKTAREHSAALYYLDSTTNIRTLTLPAFSEDVTIVKNRVVVTNEASANKYVVGKFFGSNKVYSYPLYTQIEAGQE